MDQLIYKQMDQLKYKQMDQLKYYKSMEFYSNIKNSGIPILSQQEYSCLYGLYPDIDYIIKTNTSILTFKMAFKTSAIDYINENETQKFVNETLNLSKSTGIKSTGIKCNGYFIGNVKMSDKAYDIFKKAKQQYANNVYFSFCCDCDQDKLNQKILRMLYLNQLFLYDKDGDCIMIES
jgi:hypothetical protein